MDCLKITFCSFVSGPQLGHHGAKAVDSPCAVLFIADAVPDRSGLFVLAACNEVGVIHGPALARHLTELIIDDETQMDRARYAFDRFC